MRLCLGGTRRWQEKRIKRLRLLSFCFHNSKMTEDAANRELRVLSALALRHKSKIKPKIPTVLLLYYFSTLLPPVSRHFGGTDPVLYCTKSLSFLVFANPQKVSSANLSCLDKRTLFFALHCFPVMHQTCLVYHSVSSLFAAVHSDKLYCSVGEYPADCSRAIRQNCPLICILSFLKWYLKISLKEHSTIL